MQTKQANAKVSQANNAKGSKINTGKVINKKVVKVTKVKEISKFKLMQNASAKCKLEAYSLSQAIKIVQSLPDSDPFIVACDIDVQGLTPNFVLKNIVNVPMHKMINNEVFVSRKVKGVQTDVKKVKWSYYNVLQSIYYEK